MLVMVYLPWSQSNVPRDRPFREFFPPQRCRFEGLDNRTLRRGILNALKTAKDFFDARSRGGDLAVSAGVPRISTLLSIW